MVVPNLQRQLEDIARRADEFRERGIGPRRVLVGADLGLSRKSGTVPLHDVKRCLDAALGDARYALANVLLNRSLPEVVYKADVPSALNEYQALQTAILDLAWLSGDTLVVNAILGGDKG